MAEQYTMKKHPLSNRLTPQQETAIDLIVAGQNDREVAQAVGKSRSTINIWRNHDPLFMATLNNHRQQVQGTQLTRLNTLVGEAVDALQDGLHDEDVKVRIVSAVHILKATGVYGASLPGSEQTDPAEIAAEREAKAAERIDKVGSADTPYGTNTVEYSSRGTQESYFFAEAQEDQLLREIEDANQQFKAEEEKEKIAYWEQLLPLYAEIPQETLDALDETALQQLILDFVQTRDTYLKTLKEDLTHTADVDRPVWDDYTEEVAHQVDMEVDRAKRKTDPVVQVFMEAWARRGGDAAELLDQAKRRKGRKSNPMLLPNGFQLPARGET